MGNLCEELNVMYEKFFKECDGTSCSKELDNLCNKYKYNLRYIKDATITQNYANRELKLLIIGQEKRIDKKKDILERQGECKKDIECHDFSYLYGEKPNPHWKATLLTAIKFNKHLSIKEMENVEEKLKNNNLDKNNYENIEFAFTNYYKCSISKNGNSSTQSMIHKECMKRCSECLQKEINILKPNLIIKQGKNWGEYFFNNNYTFVRMIKVVERCIVKKTKKTFRMSLNEYKYEDGNSFYVIDAYHPCLQNSYNFKGHKEYLYELIDEFLEVIKFKSF